MSKYHFYLGIPAAFRPDTDGGSSHYSHRGGKGIPTMTTDLPLKAIAVRV